MDESCQFIWEKKAGKIRPAELDVWKPFRNSNQHHAAQAAILFDRFHFREYQKSCV